MTFTIGTFNILARGLAEGEFLSEGGDHRSIVWEKRGPQVANVLTQMLKTCDVVVTQENDSFFSLLNQIRSTLPHIQGLYCLKTSFLDSQIGLTNARSIQTINRLNQSIREGLLPFSQTIDPVPKDPNHEKHYALLNEMNRMQNRFPTFHQECGIYGTQLAELYGKKGDDIYISDDGIGIYYNSQNLTLQNQLKPMCQILDIPIFFNRDGWIKSIFTTNQHTITLFGAHLPSGETPKDECQRVSIFKEILDQANSATNPFIAMDSNNSPEYESKYQLPETISSLMTLHGWADSVSKTGFECFKMRHNMGGQPKKYCLLMFDTIDKILYKNATTVDLQLDSFAFGFRRYDPSYHSTIHAIRTNDSLRSTFENQCKSAIKTDDSLIMFHEQMFHDMNLLHPIANLSTIFQGLYPNQTACSDHPPIVSQFVLSESN